LVRVRSQSFLLHPCITMLPEVFSSGFLLLRKQERLQFLLMKHATRWDLPKGHLDPGETKERAAFRELQEETGINPSDVVVAPAFAFVQQYYVSYKKEPDKPRLKELTIYLGFLSNDSPIVTTEHAGFQWFDWNPPHTIQTETIDALLQQVGSYLKMTLWNERFESTASLPLG
jgi:bis(5'-nucleosidyl)-tetraphosphatase